LVQECADGDGSNPPWEKIVARAWSLAYGRSIIPTEAEHVATSLRSGEITLEQLCLALFNSNEFVFLE
jgi:hypothetical protein